jgi:hypothetical protein
VPEVTHHTRQQNAYVQMACGVPRRKWSVVHRSWIGFTTVRRYTCTYISRVFIPRLVNYDPEGSWLLDKIDKINPQQLSCAKSFEVKTLVGDLNA